MLICNKRQLARQIVAQMFMEYREDEYCNTNLSLGACNSRSSTDARENVLSYLRRRHPDANIFPQLEKLPSGTESMTSTTLENSDLPRNVGTLTDKDTIIAAVVSEQRVKSLHIMRDFCLLELRNLRNIYSLPFASLQLHRFVPTSQFSTNTI